MAMYIHEKGVLATAGEDRVVHCLEYPLWIADKKGSIELGLNLGNQHHPISTKVEGGGAAVVEEGRSSGVEMEYASTMCLFF